MGHVARKPIESPPLTFDELYRQIVALPEGVTGQILTPGELTTMGRPGFPHRLAQRRCTSGLSSIDRMEGGTGWWIEVEAEIRFPRGRLLVPDLAGWRVERVPEPLMENPITTLPDWCAEIISPSSARIDRVKKLHIYTECGIAHVWLVDPEAHTVEVFVPHEGLPLRVATAADDEHVALPPFDLLMDFAPWWVRQT